MSQHKTHKKVKCKVTGEVGFADEFFKYNNNYYKTEEIFKWYKKEQDAYNQIKDYFCIELFNYKKTGYDPWFISKRLKKLGEEYSYSEILHGLNFSKREIEKARLSKNFSSEIAATSYLLAIVESNLYFIKKKEISEAKLTKKDSQRDIENLAALMNIESSNDKPKKKKRDISNLL